MPQHSNRENREIPLVSQLTFDWERSANVSDGKADMHAHGKSHGSIVCAGQRPDQEGWSPSGARMRSAISKSGGNASLAGERG